jgi:predicted RNA-binding protein with PIN domain
VRKKLESSQKIVVDGYNVIYADDGLRRIAGADIERSRRKLIKMAAAYLAGKELRITLVFDGRGGIADAETVIPGKLEVVYSARHQTADELIVKMIAGSQNPRSHIVVTSDRAHIRPAVSEIGCPVIESKDFLSRLRGRTKNSAAEPADRESEEKPRGGSDDLDYWLDRFKRGS